MEKADSDLGLFGVGLYTVPEASRLTGIPYQSIRRWLFGYGYTVKGRRHFSEPLWTSEIETTENEKGLGFHDLIELRFVFSFRKRGVTWQAIKDAAENAKQLFETNHPFSALRFRTDGRSIFAELINDRAEKALLDLVRSQYAFHQVISKSLYRDLDYETPKTLRPMRWWPLGRSKQVVIDPLRAFGAPIVEEEGVPTATLSQAYSAAQSFKDVASWYDVSRKAVRDAVRFEQKIAA